MSVQAANDVAIVRVNQDMRSMATRLVRLLTARACDLSGSLSVVTSWYWSSYEQADMRAEVAASSEAHATLQAQVAALERANAELTASAVCNLTCWVPRCGDNDSSPRPLALLLVVV